jgi:hypothetical protein
LRREEVGEAQVLDQNVFVEQLFNQTVLTELSDADLEAYREPYPTRDSRCPLLEWSHAMPLGMNRPTLSAALQAYCRLYHAGDTHYSRSFNRRQGFRVRRNYGGYAVTTTKEL